MKKIALIFILAVIAPSLVLAWLALRSLRDQQFVLERQRSLVYQGVADALATQVSEFLIEQQYQFRTNVDRLLAIAEPGAAAATFDDQLRANWSLAQVGFAVAPNGTILSPSPLSRPEARLFCEDNSLFLGNREAAEVYWNPKIGLNNSSGSVFLSPNPAAQTIQPQPAVAGNLKQQQRAVLPQQQIDNQGGQQEPAPGNFSKLAAAEAEFRQLMGGNDEGALSRFLDDKLNVMFWYRPARDSALVFGAQLSLPRLVERLQAWLKPFEPTFREQLCIAVLNDKARPVFVSPDGFSTDWKRPFVATEVGEALPHWEAVVYLRDPGEMARSAKIMSLTLGLLITLLVVAIGVGSWLIVRDLNRQLILARQKTDFVSNVSHELKTPLTSIRMFSELLAEGRIAEPSKQQSYLNIITAEAARLTRLINNVLDFARLDRGEKKYSFESCDLNALTRETAETYRAHLENNGFKLAYTTSENAIVVRGDPDALSQVVVNLLSNAEKYSNGQREIELRVQKLPADNAAEVQVLDRGPGVPAGSEERIFEKFYRAQDSLSSGIQGSGLGLTLARQIARNHGGDVTYSRREGGGSCFTLRLPIAASSRSIKCVESA